jgi:hypothetical protein
MNNDGPRYTRAVDLDVHETEDGLIVFDASTDRVHHLNFSAGALFELCRGTHDVTELAALMADLYDLSEPPIETVESGLRQLVEEGVLVESHGK